MSHPTDADVRDMLRHFAISGATIQALGNRGGFSGARIWRVASSHGEFCLKAWPPDGITPDRHREIVRLLRHARLGGLSFIPTTSDHLECAGRVWDLTDWMPGVADFHADPSINRLRAACTALARLHAVWAEFAGSRRPCQAVSRRLIAAGEWIDSTVASCAYFKVIEFGRTKIDDADPVAPWIQQAREAIESQITVIPSLLERWRSVLLPVQPCVCDVWHDHVLFAGDEVTGIIDFGALKIDNVAVDLARMLGSLVGDDKAMFEAGLDAYAAIQPLSEPERALVPILDRTGVVLGLANWLRRLYQHGGDFQDRVAVAKRMSELVLRVENWASVEP